MMFFFKLVLASLSLLSLYLISWKLGEDGVATYGIYLTLLNIMTIIILWGGGVRIVDDYTKHNSETYGVVLKSILLNSILMVILSIILYCLFQKKSLLMVIPSVSLSFMLCLSSYYYVRGRTYSGMLVSDGVKNFFPVLFISLFCIIGYETETELLILAVLSSISIGPFLLLKKLISISGSSQFNIKIWWQYIKNNTLVVAPTIFIILSQQFDRIILSTVVSSQEIAALFSAQTLLVIIFLGLQTVVNKYLPVISKVATLKSGSLQQEAKKIFVFIVLIGVASIPLGWVYLNNLEVDVIMSMKIYIIMLVGVIVSLLFGIGQGALQFLENKKIYFYHMAFVITAQLAILGSLFPVLGVFSAPVAFSISTILSRYLSYYYWEKNGVHVGVWRK